MKFNHLTLIIILLGCFTTSLQAQLNKDSTPNWIVKQTYESSPDIDLEEISYGILTLLDDEQIHIPKKERYFRMVKKITDNVGVQEASNISINFDPTFQELFLHDISIIRNGKRIDKLNLNDFQTIRQESNSENHIYDGSLNAMVNLSDIRRDDILDYSYTKKGFNPIHGSHFSGATSLDGYQPIGKINYYLISDKPLYYTQLNSDAKPTIANYKAYKTYSWQSSKTEKPHFEENTPSWYIPYKSLFISDHETWGDVVDWAIDVYGDHDKPSKELQSKVKLILESYDNESERISETLKFVQNEIRYLGLESGIGAYKPFSPSKVLEQRFGDCKDKTWLMVSMLRNMGVEAYPMLVNTTLGETLDELQPSQKIFDHVVVKVVDSLKNDIYYDPTISNQFGHHSQISFPNYGHGLVIKKGVNDLEKLTPNGDDLVEVYDTFNLPKVNAPATLKTSTVYTAAEADVMRRRYKSSSLSSLSDDFKNYYTSYYNEIEVVEQPHFDDDTIDNRIIVGESYKINALWNPMIDNKKMLMAEFTPYGLFDVIVSPSDKNRTTPFALYYPTHKIHNITVKLPESWGLTGKDDIEINCKAFDFSLKTSMNPSRTILYINYEYKNKLSYVSPEDFDEYYEKIKEVENVLSYYISIPKNGSVLSSGNLESSKRVVSLFVNALFWIVVVIVILGVGFAIYSIQQNKKNKPKEY